MKKTSIIFFFKIFIIILLIGCGPEEKPKICDCQNEFFRIGQSGGTTLSPFLEKCEKYYTIFQLTGAECGLENYDPNFKAK